VALDELHGAPCWPVVWPGSRSRRRVGPDEGGFRWPVLPGLPRR
jgi:hypothetical protein